MEVRTMWRSGKGFTLIELMVVIAIILILALIAVPAYRNMQIRAKKARAQEDLRNIATALEAYYVDWNEYPAEGSWMADLVGRDYEGQTCSQSGTTATGESAPVSYINSIPDDPFNPGSKYNYDLSDDGTQYWIWSVGPDGTDNTHSGDDIVRTNS